MSAVRTVQVVFMSFAVCKVALRPGRSQSRPYFWTAHTLNVEAAIYFEKSVTFYHSTWRHIPEHFNLYNFFYLLLWPAQLRHVAAPWVVIILNHFCFRNIFITKQYKLQPNQNRVLKYHNIPKRNSHKVLTAKREGKRPLGRPSGG